MAQARPASVPDAVPPDPIPPPIDPTPVVDPVPDPPATIAEAGVDLVVMPAGVVPAAAAPIVDLGDDQTVVWIDEVRVSSPDSSGNTHEYGVHTLGVRKDAK